MAKRRTLLKAYLKATGQTYSGFAEKLGLHRAMVWRWAHGTVPETRDAIAIEIISNGEVPVASWGTRKLPKQRKILQTG